MSDLEAFLHPEAVQEKKEILISDRFQKDGKPVPFVIRAVSEEENQKIRKACTRKYRGRTGSVETDFDTTAYSVRLIMAGTVSPDFSASELCEGYGTTDPMEVPGKMLRFGEYNRLADEISKLSGLDDDLDALAKN